MELIIGGSYQGKLDYVLSLTDYTMDHVYNAYDYDLKVLIDKALIDKVLIDEVTKKPVLNHFHLLIKGLLDLGIDPYPVVNTILSTHKDIIIISDDIGSGIVPLLASDRRYRETLGRILCLLAQEAIRVHRVILGIGTIIK